jgi:plasmid stability protein
MSETTKRSTIYLEEHLHRALRLKAASVDASMSEIVNDALRAAFEEDAEDLADIQAREKEPSDTFENFIASLKASGRL